MSCVSVRDFLYK
uniref:Uncharacterized protein n=1 Tax=Anguilla anguilla TaxID=7936 RepID=A0A0E9TCK6_ANGAN